MRYPPLLEERRRQLFEIIELALKNGGIAQVFRVYWNGAGTCHFHGQSGAFKGDFQHLVLVILSDCGYAKYIEKPEKGLRQFVLTALSLDYYHW